MKLFGVILLTSYFLAREDETGPAKPLAALMHDWGVYVLCSGTAVFVGWLLSAQLARNFYPAAVFLAAALPAILFRGRPLCMIAGAATAFCVLRWLPDVNRMAMFLFSAEIAVLILAFFYQGARERMLRLNVPYVAHQVAGRFLILLSMAVLLALIYQKAIQVF